MQNSPEAQTLPHWPQLFGSLLVSMQPLLPQHRRLLGQQPPMQQELPEGHVSPQAPQFCGSVCRSAQTWPQTLGHELLVHGAQVPLLELQPPAQLNCLVKEPNPHVQPAQHEAPKADAPHG